MPLSIRYSDLQARQLTYWIIAVECAFAVAYLVIHIWNPELSWGPLRPLFDLNRENSLPTWFSTTQLFTVGVLFVLAAMNNRQKAFLSNSALLVAGAGFILLSADEGAQLHEHLDYMARHFGRQSLLFGGKWGAWILVYVAFGLLVVALGAKHLKALWRNFNSVAVVMLAGAVVYVTGAAGFEIASFPFRNSGTNLDLSTIVLEEFLEMLGVSIILYATLILASRLSAELPAPAD